VEENNKHFLAAMHPELEIFSRTPEIAPEVSQPAHTEPEREKQPAGQNS
jgi:hypothetical protein